MKRHEKNNKVESEIRELDEKFREFLEKRHSELLEEENDFRKTVLKKRTK